MEGTAVKSHDLLNVGWGTYLHTPICTCNTDIPDTGGMIYCPYHGYMVKHNGELTPINKMRWDHADTEAK